MHALAKGEPIALALDPAKLFFFAEDGSAIG
jgi:hypothetical protein